MDFSIFISHQRLFPHERYGGDLYEDKLAEAKAADRCGFNCIWVPEHHLIQYMQAPNGLLLLVHYAHHVKAPLGQMVNLLVYRHPLVAAGEIAQADALIGGRLQLGVGRGAYEYEFRRLGIPWDSAYDRFHECLDVIETIWRHPDRGVAYQGKFFQFETTFVWPRLVQKPHPPIWYAAMTPPAIEFAAKRGYHVATWPFLRPMSFVEEIVAKFHEAREAAGNAKGVQQFSLMRPVHVAETEKKARESVETMLVNHRLSQRIRGQNIVADDRGYVAPDPLPDEPTFEETFDRMIAGTPQQCLEKLHRYHELGVDQFMCWFDFGLETARNIDSMQLFAEEVMAPFRKATGRAPALPRAVSTR